VRFVLVPVLLVTGTIAAFAGRALAEDPAAPQAPDAADGPRLVRRPLRCVLDDARIRVTGWADVFATTTVGHDNAVRAGRVFDDDAQGIRLNQAYLGVERVPADGCCTDVGGKVALLWGTDARFVHARGLLDDQAPEEYQFDLLELWGSVRFPVAKGLTLKAGKFTTPMGFEVIEAPNNLLPSRTFLFGYAIPFTHVGGIAKLELNERLSVSGGLFLGWDVWDDNNDALTPYAGFTWSPSDRDSLTANLIVGAERLQDDDDLRSVLDLTWTREWDACWQTALNADIGLEEGAAGGDDAMWWGAAGYLTRHVTTCLSATGRAEFFRDADGTRLGQAASLGALTVGLDWTPRTPFPIFHVRPEIRWDHSFQGAFFDDGSAEDQLSFTLECIIGF
jgi:hypothetical protein